MERLNKSKKALTLLELLIAITLLTVVLLTASTLLISFKKFYFDFVKRQAEVGEVSLGVLEEIVNRIKVANKISISSPTAIYIYVDNTDPASSADDTTYLYYQSGSTIRYRYKIDDQSWSSKKTIAQHIGLLNFELQPTADPAFNQVKVTIGVIPSSGTQQNFETTAILGAKCAQGDFAPSFTSIQGTINQSQGLVTVDLAWIDNSYTETGFKLERSENPTGPFTTVVTTLPDAVTYRDTFTWVPPNRTFYYRLCACLPAGDSSYEAGTVTIP